MISVLYVDDEPGLLEIARLFLEESGGFAVTTTTSAVKSLELLSTQSFDAIIADYQMPEIDGIALLKTVRERFDDIPFILFTGRGREQIVIDAINNGADFYLQKGGDPKSEFAELAHKIRQAVRRREAERELRQSESRLRSFLETTHESVALVDEAGKVVEWNTGAERISGIGKKEALGSYLWDLTFRMLPREHRTQERRALIEQRIRTSLRTGIPVFDEPRDIEAERPDGSRIYTRQTLFPFRTDKGFGIGSIAQDITGEKLAEGALRESEKKYKDLAELLPLMIFELDLDLKVTYANWHAFTTLGFTQKDIDQGQCVLSFIVPSDHEKVNEKIKNFLEGTPAGPQEYTAVRRDKSTFPILVYTAPVYRNKKLIGFRGMAIDISERKVMENALRSSEQKFRDILSNINDAIFILELDEQFRCGKFMDVNDVACRMTGYTREELLQMEPADLDNRVYNKPDEVIDRELTETGASTFETIYTRKDKSRLPVEISVHLSLMRGKRVSVAVVRDITERRATEAALEAVIASMVGTTGLNSLKKIVETVNTWLGVDCVMVGEIQPDGDTVKVLSMILDGKEVNDFIYHLRNTPCENVAEKGFCHYPEDSVRLFPNAKDITELNIQGYVGTPLRDSQGKVSGILCALSRKPMQLPPSVKKILETIAVKAAAEVERNRIERELRESQQMAAKAMDLANLVNWELDLRTGLLKFNDRFYALYGTSAEREGGYLMTPEKYIREFVHPEDREIVATIFRGGPPPPSDPASEFQMEHRIVRRDGGIRTIIVRIGILQDSGGQDIIVHGANQDITDRKKMEEALRQANKKLSLLSGITRHDISNQLMALNGFVVLLQRSIQDPDQKKFFSRITEASSNIAEMITFTREYEKIGTGAPVWQNLTTVITAAGKGIIPERFTFKNDLPATTEIFADPMLEKVFFNLLDNAIRHGERVTQIHVSSRPEGNDLILVWEDNGVGIAADEKERIFERGFGKNTGLGMFLVREILSLTGITIRENGEPGTGARFEMTVPHGSFR